MRLMVREKNIIRNKTCFEGPCIGDPLGGGSGTFASAAATWNKKQCQVNIWILDIRARP